jgi:AhpD family alkylhydroperoxidase
LDEPGRVTRSDVGQAPSAGTCRKDATDRALPDRHCGSGAVEPGTPGALPDTPGSRVPLPRAWEDIMTKTRGEVEADIKETLGLVPHFFSRIPDSFLEPEWEIFKRMELGETLIPNKYKELMGVALHAETKCHYCTLFHTEAAKLFGATDEEIQEAVHYAKTSLGWSAYLNGIREDYDGFAAELAQIGAYMSSRS